MVIYPFEIVFDPPASNPGDLVRITATVHNVGYWDVPTVNVYFAYDIDPFSIDIEPAFIGMAVIDGLGIDQSDTASVMWDTTGTQMASYPVYVYAEDYLRREQCAGAFAFSDFLVPVTLLSFDATPGDGRIELSWTTETEIGNQGFRIFRSESYFDGYQELTDRLIPGAGTSYAKRSYRYLDEAAQNGKPYFYKLAMVSAQNELQWSEIAAAVPAPGDPSPRIRIWTDRAHYKPGERMKLHGSVENSGPKREVKVVAALVINRSYAGDLLPAVTFTAASGSTATARLFEYLWTGAEPQGQYAVLAALLDPATDALMDLVVSEFTVASH